MHLTCHLIDEKARPRLAASPGLGVFSGHWWQSRTDEKSCGLRSQASIALVCLIAALCSPCQADESGCDCHLGSSPLLSPLSMAADDLLISAAVCFVRAGTQEGNTGSCLSSPAQELCVLGKLNNLSEP